MNRRVEYRVVGDGWVSACPIDGRDALEAALAIVEGKGIPNVRIEVREIVETPWEPLPEEEQQ